MFVTMVITMVMLTCMNPKCEWHPYVHNPRTSSGVV
jgi:hypothetical protein